MTERIKLLLAVVLLLAVAVGAVAVLASATRLQRASLEGADPGDVFTPVAEVPLELAAPVTWRPDAPTPRPMEPATRVLLEDAWVGAFARLDVALRLGAVDDLPTSFSGDALDQVLATVAASDPGRRQVPVSHDLELTFYADDGSVVGLRDHALRVRRGVGSATVEAVESWEAVVLLHDGRWRVQHLVRHASVPAAPVAPTTPAGTA